MTIQKKYLKSQEQAIASYDFIDIAEGTGIVVFQGFSTQLSGANLVYNLGREVIESSEVETANQASSTTMNFDTTPFNLPKIIKGKAIVRFSGSLSVSNVASTTLWFEITIQKSSGGVITDLGSAISHNISKSGTQNVDQSFVVPLTLGLSHFKKDDFLRVRIIMKFSGAIPVNIAIGHDPTNRVGTELSDVSRFPTTLECLIPFRIDL